MQEVVILERQEYKNIMEELTELRDYKRNKGNFIKRIYKHDFKDEILVVEADINKINKFFNFEENSQVIILKSNIK